MWAGKSSAKTFFSRFFEKKKKSNDPEVVPSRKRSHSLFAPNTSALMSGIHFGGRGGSTSMITGESLGVANPNLCTSSNRARLLSMVPQPPSMSREDTSDLDSDNEDVQTPRRNEEHIGDQGKPRNLLDVEQRGQEDKDPQSGREEGQMRSPLNEGVQVYDGLDPGYMADCQVYDGRDRDCQVYDGRDYEEEAQAYSRLYARRATDFSQADNDLRRFLASRKSKDPGCTETSSPTNSSLDLRKDTNHSVIHRRIYGSVEALEGEERVQRNRRFRIESSEDSEECPDIPPTPVLENPEHQTRWYLKYFLGKLHRNYVGQDQNKNNYILSLLEEKSFGKSQFRAVLWTHQGPKRIRFRGKDKNITLKQILCKFSWLSKMERLPREVLSPNIQKDILWLEKQEGSSSFKFGVIYAKPGQIMDDELLSNQTESKNFTNFLEILGDRIRLKGWCRYKGGLDVKGDMTGQHSVYTQFEEHEIMYHISTLLPYSVDDSQQVERKRHIGNDIVNIIFVDGSKEDLRRFKPLFIKSQFTHIYAAVCYEPTERAYLLTVYSEKSVPLYGPSLPNYSGFTDHQEFRRFLLVKCINGEKATYNTEVFATKRERTYQLLLNDSLEQYGGGEESRPAKDRMSLSESISDSSRMYRRKDNSRKDVFVKVGQALKLENLVNGDPGQVRGTKEQRMEKMFRGTKPWDPISVHTSLQIEVMAGDSWAGVGLLVAAREGGWILRQKGPPEKVFSLAPIVQVNILESLGIMVFRTEKAAKDLSQVFVYRLSELETNNKILGREELREHGLESSKGCTGYSLSNREHSGLRMAITVGKRILVYSWTHAEEWMDFTADTVQGFQLLQEFTCLEQPMVVTLVERSREGDRRKCDKDFSLVVGSRRGFEIIDVTSGNRQEVLTQECEPSDIQELWEEERVELLLTHSCSSLFLREEEGGGWRVHREIQWNCQPKQVIPAFPYTLAFSPDTVEVRSTVNSSLLQTLNLPKLSLIAIKDDIFFTTTKMINNLRRNCDMEQMSKFCDPLYNIYKIPWSLLVGQPTKSFSSQDRYILEQGGASSSYPTQSTGSSVQTKTPGSTTSNSPLASDT